MKINIYGFVNKMFKLIGLMTYEHTGCHGNKREIMETEKRTKVVDRATLTVSQNIMYGIKSVRLTTSQ